MFNYHTYFKICTYVLSNPISELISLSIRKKKIFFTREQVLTGSQKFVLY